jgi:hypothetical protein
MIFMTFDFIHLSTCGTMTNDIFEVWLYSFEYLWYNNKWYCWRLTSFIWVLVLKEIQSNVKNIICHCTTSTQINEDKRQRYHLSLYHKYSNEYSQTSKISFVIVPRVLKWMKSNVINIICHCTTSTMTNNIFDVWLHSFEYTWYNDKWYLWRLTVFIWVLVVQ